MICSASSMDGSATALSVLSDSPTCAVESKDGSAELAIASCKLLADTLCPAQVQSFTADNLSTYRYDLLDARLVFAKVYMFLISPQ